MIFNFGSINIDHFYALPRLPGPGETLSATGLTKGLGGKGANQSVAAAQAGATVRHIGAVGPDGGSALAQLEELGVHTGTIRTSGAPTGHAIVMVDSKGENQIIVYPGANHEQSVGAIGAALKGGASGDWLMLQNETTLQVEAARIAREQGLKVAYSAAPFDEGAVMAIRPFIDMLIVNESEAAQLEAALEKPVDEFPVPNILVTRGARGANWYDTKRREIVSVPAFDVTPVDTAGAGDTFTGYAIAALSRGNVPEDALRYASAAAAISVTRYGTAAAIPSRDEVDAFLT